MLTNFLKQQVEILAIRFAFSGADRDSFPAWVEVDFRRLPALALDDKGLHHCFGQRMLVRPSKRWAKVYFGHSAADRCLMDRLVDTFAAMPVAIVEIFEHVVGNLNRISFL